MTLIPHMNEALTAILLIIRIVIAIRDLLNNRPSR